MNPDHDPEIQRAEAFRRQCRIVREQVDKLFHMHAEGYGRADSNMDLRAARASLRVMLGEVTIEDFIGRAA